jgi:AraC-like DNA-binding protein
MKNSLLKTIFTTFLMTVATGVIAQLTVRGTVVDASGEPIIGANVLVKGSTVGTITDFDGNYSLEVADSRIVLVFSYIGMQSQEKYASEINGKTITLSEDAEVLEEVVVVGFGTQKKATLTGSVAVVGAKAFEDKGSLSSPLEALQGQVPGVIITRSSSAPGDEGWSMNLRGQVSMNSTEPLIIIDGVAAGDSKRYTVESIAQQSGFNSRASFFRVFKKKVGMTPNEYIRNQ